MVVLTAVLGLAPAGAAESAQEQDMVNRVNATRAAHGLPALVVENALADNVARPWAQHLAQQGSLQHNPNLQQQAPPGWTAIGENVAFGPDVASIEQALENDPPHLANILNPNFTNIGVGIVADASGVLWAVQDFTNGPPQNGQTTATTAPASTTPTTPAASTPASPTPASGTPATTSTAAANGGAAATGGPVTNVDLGTHTVGETFGAVVNGPWTAGTVASLTLNGVAAGHKNVNADGTVTLVITILSQGRVSVDDIVPGVVGVNTIGVVASDGTNTFARTATFTLSCATGVGVFLPQLAGVLPGGVSTCAPNALGNGTVIAPSFSSTRQQQEEQQTVTLGDAKSSTAGDPPAKAAPAAASGGAASGSAAGAALARTDTIPFTGANVTRLALLALVLGCLGVAIVKLSPRRPAGRHYR